jgi:CRP-like cAMP-binding protein
MDASRLAAIPFFAELGEDALSPLAEAASQVDAEAGEKLAIEGDFGHAMYAIESGTADVTGADGARLGELGPGDVFGEIAIIASGRRTATVTATSGMRLIALYKRDVWALERRAPAAAERLRALIAERRADPA